MSGKQREEGRESKKKQREREEKDEREKETCELPTLSLSSPRRVA